MNREFFISSHTNLGCDTESIRNEIADKFEIIQEKISCAHQNSDAFYMADFILRYANDEGPLVEFGCYQGGMSCKLSILAGMLGKKYYIFDSFTGLPEEVTYLTFDPNLPFLGRFQKYQFACSSSQVINNLQNYGNIYATQIVEGNIHDTLLENAIKPSFIFIDVDLYPTANFIIQNIWEKLSGCALFTHESCLIDYMAAIMNIDFWKDNFDMLPPKLGHYYQNGDFGLKGAECLNCIVKDPDKFKLYADVISMVS